MDEKLGLVFDELFPALEALETRSVALLQLLKEKGIASEQELAPHLEQAANASSVRWLAARVRINYLLSAPAGEDVTETNSAPHREKDPEPVADTNTATAGTPDEKSDPSARKDARNSGSENNAAQSTENSHSEAAEENNRPEGNAGKDAA